MLYLLGYSLAAFIFISGLGITLSSLYRRSAFMPQSRIIKTQPTIRAHALISFSIILPFSALAFAILTFTAMKIAPEQVQQGHIKFVIAGLLIPTISFLLGYFYFEKAVRS